MVSIWKWLLVNFFNLITFLGFVVTIYLGFFYVPDWFDDAQKQKITNAERKIETTIKELIYTDSIAKYSEIAALIKAGELEIGQSYPLSIDQVLVRVQSSFLEDKFLPLEKRRACVSEIQSIRKSIPVFNETGKKDKAQFSFLPWISALISLLIVGIGIYSFYLRFRKEKETEEELSNQVVEIEQLLPDSKTANAFENQLIKVFEDYPGIEIIQSPNDIHFDLVFKYNQKAYYVEIKFLRSKIGLHSFERFARSIVGLEGEFWFIYNTDLTQMVKNRYHELNRYSNASRQIKLIQIQSANDLKQKLKELL